MLRTFALRTTIPGTQRPFRAKTRFGTCWWGRLITPFVLGPGGDSETSLLKPPDFFLPRGWMLYMGVAHGSGGYYIPREGRAMVLFVRGLRLVSMACFASIFGVSCSGIPSCDYVPDRNR